MSNPEEFWKWEKNLAKRLFEEKPVPDAYAVISGKANIEYTVSCKDDVTPDYAKELCHEHINDCAGSGIEGAGKWVVRPIRIYQEVT